MEQGSSSRADGPPIFSPTHYPELKQLGRRAIHAFLEERARYLRLVADAQSQGSTMQPVSVVASVKFELLKAWVALKTFPGISSVDKLSDDILLTWLKTQDQVTVDTCSVEELNTAVKKKVFMKLKEPDPTMRVMNVFTDYLMLLSERKMDSFVDENPKLAIQHIVTALRPLALQEKIHNDLILYKQTLAKDWHKFYAYVTEKTVALDQFLPAIEQIRRKPEEVRDVKKGSRKDAKAPHLSTKPQSAVSPQSEPENCNKYSGGFRKTGEQSTARTSAEASLPSCLNTKTCAGKFHFMRDCPETLSNRARETKQSRRPTARPAGRHRGSYCVW